MLFMQSFFKNALLASLAVTSLAVPIPDSLAGRDIHKAIEDRQGSHVISPPLPTVQECKDHLIVTKDTTLFYSDPGTYAKKAIEAIKSRDYLKGYKILSQSWADKDWQNQWQNDKHTSAEFFNICSQALAELSTGTSYVLPPAGKGDNWHKGTVWDNFEWPNIPSGTKVIRIDPENAKNKEAIKG